MLKTKDVKSESRGEIAPRTGEGLLCACKWEGGGGCVFGRALTPSMHHLTLWWNSSQSSAGICQTFISYSERSRGFWSERDGWVHEL